MQLITLNKKVKIMLESIKSFATNLFKVKKGEMKISLWFRKELRTSRNDKNRLPIIVALF